MSQNYAKNSSDRAFLIESLQWYLDHGVDELLLDTPIDRTAVPEIPKKQPLLNGSSDGVQKNNKTNILGFQEKTEQNDLAPEMMGAAQAIVEAQKLATACQSLEELAEAIKSFEGLSIRKNATNMVFSDGNPQSEIMLIGEAPGADEDVQGKPFVGETGQLLDKILACIGLSRSADDLSKSVYISNILNWRPPGNRSPTQAEMDISLSFIERHIALAKPKAIILCGGVAAKSILRRAETISKLRGQFYDYQVPEPLNIGGIGSIPTMVTYHPAYLIRTPAQKKAVWADMLMFEKKLQEF